MALPLPNAVSCISDKPMSCLKSDYLPSLSLWKYETCKGGYKKVWKSRKLTLTITSSIKHVRDPSLDKHVVKQNKIRFVQKLKTLLLSKPKHYMPLYILGKCRSYLSLPKPRSLISMIHRYPTIFELFTMPTPPTPFNATNLSQLCVRLTPAATALAHEESRLKSAMSTSLAIKLQKFLMLSSHHRLLLSKLVHVGPDLGLPTNFRTRLCNEHPDKFKTVDTSYGRALELVSWDSSLADPLPISEIKPPGLIVDRPLKFKRLRLRKGLNVRRHHEDFLIKFREITDVSPYHTKIGDFSKESIQAEKRACDVVREILNMMVEKRTLVDHLTHFRKEFGLPNKLRAMLLRHPELFYVSLKGQRDSVFLVECYDDKGTLLKMDESSIIKDQLLDLVREGKRMRRERRHAINNDFSYGSEVIIEDQDDVDETDHTDSLDDLFESDNFSFENSDDEEAGSSESLQLAQTGEFWSAETVYNIGSKDSQYLEPW